MTSAGSRSGWRHLLRGFAGRVSRWTAPTRRASRLTTGRIAAASLVGFYLPMHTATRLAGPLIERVRRANPAARLCAYGLYAPLNARWLRERGIQHVLGPEAEAELVELAKGNSQLPTPNSQHPIPNRPPRRPSVFRSFSQIVWVSRRSSAMRHCGCRTAARARSEAQTRHAGANTCAGIVRSCRCIADGSRRFRSMSCSKISARRCVPELGTSRSAIPISSTAPPMRGGLSNA